METFDNVHQFEITMMKRKLIPVIKHLPGQHDQRSHGNWARGTGEGNGYSQPSLFPETISPIGQGTLEFNKTVLPRFTETGYGGSAQAQQALRDVQNIINEDMDASYLMGEILDAENYAMDLYRELQIISMDSQAAQAALFNEGELMDEVYRDLDYDDKNAESIVELLGTWGVTQEEDETARDAVDRYIIGLRNNAMELEEDLIIQVSEYEGEVEDLRHMRRQLEETRGEFRDRIFEYLATDTPLVVETLTGHPHAGMQQRKFKPEDMVHIDKGLKEFGAIASNKLHRPDPQFFSPSQNRLLTHGEVTSLTAAGVNLRDHIDWKRFTILEDYVAGRITPSTAARYWGKTKNSLITDAPANRDTIAVLHNASLFGSTGSHFSSTSSEDTYGNDPDNYAIAPHIGLGSTDYTSLVHEFGHWMEYHNPKVMFMGNEFLNRRTKNDATIHMVDLVNDPRWSSRTPDIEYRFSPPEWKVKLDEFIIPYIGRIYGYGDGYTEVISTGFELFMKDGGVSLVQEDPDMWMMIYDIMQGNV